jgi:hypothetical protein
VRFEVSTEGGKTNIQYLVKAGTVASLYSVLRSSRFRKRGVPGTKPWPSEVT